MAFKKLLLFVFVLGAFSSNAQEWDFLTWHKVQLQGELVKDLKLSVEQQLRLKNNTTSIEQTFTQFGLGYDLPKGFEIEAAYRLSWSQNENGTFENRHRYNIDFEYGHKFWDLKAKLRARFQHRPSPSLFNERLKPDDSPVFVRFKLSVTYDKLKKLTPGIEFETFVRAENPNEAGVNRFRYRVFLDVDLPKRQELGAFYMLETDYSGKTLEFQSVVGVSYSYEWKRPKKKKKKDKKKKD